MKKMYFLVLTFLLLGVAGANAQVAIGTTDDPKATLDVVASSSATAADGVIPPRVSLAQLFIKNGAYGTAQTGAIVYVNDVEGQPISGKTAAVTAPGYYYFNGAKWQTMATNPRMTLADLQSGIFAEGTIVYVTDVTGTPAGATENVTEKGYYSFDGTKWNTFGGGESGASGSGLKLTKVVTPTDATHPSGYTITGDEEFVVTRWTAARSVHFPVIDEAKAGTVIFVVNENTSGATNLISMDGVPQQNQSDSMARGRGYPVLWTGTQWLILTKG